MPTNLNQSTFAGAGYLFGCGLGAELTAAATISVTDGLHVVSGSTTITTINGGSSSNSNIVYLIKKADATWQFGTGGNITGIVPSDITAGSVLTLAWDQTYWRVVNSGQLPTYLVAQSYGILPGNSSTVNTMALNNLLAVLLAAQRGARIYFSRGTYNLGSITCNQNGVILCGDGRGLSTVLNFVPTANNQTFLTFTALTAVTINYCGIADLEIRCGEFVFTKTAVKVIDGSRFTAERIFINFFRETTTHTAIGFDVRGREYFYPTDVLSYADRPFVINDNPNTTIDCDHYRFQDVTCGPVGNPGIEIAKGVNITSLHFSGDNEIAGGTHGIYFDDTSTGAGSSANAIINFQSIRWEQASTAGYLIYFARSANSQICVLIESCESGAGATNKGFYLRGINRCTMINNSYTGQIEALNADSVESLVLINNFWNTTSTFNMGSLKKLAMGDKGSGASEPGQGIEIWTSATVSGWSLYGPVTTLGGGTVVQGTSAVTAVTVDKPAGTITTFAQNIAAGAEVQFTVSNSTVTTLSNPQVVIASGSVGGTTVAHVTAVASGSFQVTLTNLAAATAETGTLVINFVILGGTTS